jgi:hypothetical protein
LAVGRVFDVLFSVGKCGDGMVKVLTVWVGDWGDADCRTRPRLEVAGDLREPVRWIRRPGAEGPGVGRGEMW